MVNPKWQISHWFPLSCQSVSPAVDLWWLTLMVIIAFESRNHVYKLMLINCNSYTSHKTDWLWQQLWVSTQMRGQKKLAKRLCDATVQFSICREENSISIEIGSRWRKNRSKILLRQIRFDTEVSPNLIAFYLRQVKISVYNFFQLLPAVDIEHRRLNTC